MGAVGFELVEPESLLGFVERQDVAEKSAATERVVEHGLGYFSKAARLMGLEGTLLWDFEELREQFTTQLMFVIELLDFTGIVNSGQFGVEDFFLEGDMGAGLSVEFVGQTASACDVAFEEGFLDLGEASGKKLVVLEKGGLER